MAECACANQVDVMFCSMISDQIAGNQVVTGVFRGDIRIMPDRTVLLTGHQMYSAWVHKRVADLVGSLPDGTNWLWKMDQYYIDSMFILKMQYASDYDAWKMSERALLTLQNCVDHLKQDFFTPSGSAFLHQVGSYQADLYEMMLLAGKEALAAADRIAQFRDPNADQPGIIEKDEAAAMLTEQEYNEIIHHQNLPAELRMIRGGLHKPEHSAERKTAFWVCSIVISAVIACVLYFTLGLKLFGGNDNFGDTFGDVFHFFCHIAPVLVIAGGIVCAIVYGMTWAEDENYNIVTYALSAGSAITGCAIGGALIYLLSLVITILWYALIVAIIVGIIVGVLDS
ncbi:MAG: hypothetical protein K5897_08110 [Eubacterium sp.]|nr:hypothetical protein [Eubacterium sp.]